MQLADQTVRLYLVDTSNLWTLAGAAREADAVAARNHATSTAGASAQLLAGIGAVLGDCSDRNLGPQCARAQQAASLALLAMSCTSTFSQVKRVTGDYAGHWFYILYRLNDGETVTRPAFIGAKAHGLLASERMIGAVRQIVATDMALDDETTVGRELRRGGGVRLAGELK
jgi:hypothetical protein